MPKFTITTDTGNGDVNSVDALEFPHAKAATDDAQIALADMAREALPGGKSADFGVKVENDAGKEIYRASMNFSAKTEDDIKRDDAEADAAADEVASALRNTYPCP